LLHYDFAVMAIALYLTCSIAYQVQQQVEPDAACMTDIAFEKGRLAPVMSRQSYSAGDVFM